MIEKAQKTGKTGELKPAGKPSKVGLDIEAKPLPLISQYFEGTAEYTPITVTKNKAKAVKLISTDLDKARRIIAGHEPVPNDMRAAPIIDAAERHARKQVTLNY